MRVRPVVEASLWAGTLAFTVLTFLDHRSVPSSWTSHEASLLARVPGESPDTKTDAHAAARRLANRNPFTLRGGSSDAGGAGLAGEPSPLEMLPEAVSRPALILSGVLGGPPWEALIEGVPGREGSILVRPGDSIADLRIRHIAWDTMVVERADSSWTITMKRAWQ